MGRGGGSSASSTGSGSGSPTAAGAGGGSGVVNPGITGIPPKKAAYNPADYTAAMRGVPDDVKALFEHIYAFKPRGVELDCKLRCFVPDYLPAVGEVDAFLKPPRPDGAPEPLGLATLDEPSATPSDPTVLDLQLRAASKRAGVEPVLVRSVEYADKNPKEITKWIQSVVDVHKSKPPPSVHYAKPMPDIEALMQEWPPGFEAALKEAALPGADLDLSVEEYARVVCALLDVPIYNNSIIPSLHVLFTLYNEFKANQHFANMAEGGASASGGATASAKAAFNAELDSILAEGKE